MIELAIGIAAPEFELTSLDGQTVRLSDLHGTPVLLNFYKSNCSWCQTEMPQLAQVYERLNDVNVKVFGIDIGDDSATAARFANEKGLEFPILLGDSATALTYHLKRVPTLVLVDETGNIACVYEGVTEQLSGIVELTMLAAAGRHELPEYSLVGNGCSPDAEG
jgi:peroxiredoxin